jgi:hypothetical protein
MIDTEEPPHGVLELATFLSVATRIEPELIRAMRLTLLPQLDVGTEADLWFSELVTARGPDAIMLDPQRLPDLRARLAELANPHLLDQVWDVVHRVHASTLSPALLLEERVTWLAVANQVDIAETALQPALHALVVEDRTGIANWLTDAWPRLPDAIRTTTTAWQLATVTTSHLAPLHPAPTGRPGHLAITDAVAIATALPEVPLIMRRDGQHLTVGETAPDAVAVLVPDTEPRIIELELGDSTRITIQVPSGQTTRVRVGWGSIRLRTARGAIYQLDATQPAVGTKALPEPTAPIPSSHHHGSHLDLLSSIEGTTSPTAAIDAIIVPAAARPIRLTHAIRLASHLNCALIALASGYASGRQIARYTQSSDVKLIAIDIDRLPARIMPDFHTADLLAGTLFEFRDDTNLKRNLGLLISHLLGWRRVVLLDEQVTIPKPSDLQEAAGLLDSYSTVGLRPAGYPNDSAVDHANLLTGGRHNPFMDDTLVVRTDTAMSFFPAIYRSHWFFLLDGVHLRPTAITGEALRQPYDPLRDDRKARQEEFGSTLTEGLFSLLDNHERISSADEIFWDGFIQTRGAFIDDIIRRIETADLDESTRRTTITAMKGARGRNRLITPRLCVDYLRAWQRDLILWHEHLQRMTPSDLATILTNTPGLDSPPSA